LSSGQIWFAFTITGETNPTRVVVYSIDQQCWWPLMLGRCSGAHFTQGDTRPYMGSTDGYIYQHENTRDANGAAISWSAELSPYCIAEGSQGIDVERLDLDLFQQSGDVTYTLTTYDRLDGAVMDSETDTVPAAGPHFVDARVSGRYIGMEFSGSAADGYFRLGKPVAHVRPTWRRP
jgi:hypothetical protein